MAWPEVAESSSEVWPASAPPRPPRRTTPSGEAQLQWWCRPCTSWSLQVTRKKKGNNTFPKAKGASGYKLLPYDPGSTRECDAGGVRGVWGYDVVVSSTCNQS